MLVAFEIAAVIAAAIVAASGALGQIPVILPLLIAASAARWAAGKSFAGVTRAQYVGIGVIVGLAALVLSLVIGTPIAESLSDRAVQWAEYPMVRGQPSMFLAFGTIVLAVAVASELVLRGWIVERVLERGGTKAIAVMVGAIAEALITPGPLDARIGAFVVGIALGQLYVAAGRNVAVPAAARVAFGLGALVLEMLRITG